MTDAVARDQKLADACEIELSANPYTISIAAATPLLDVLRRVWLPNGVIHLDYRLRSD